jgi:molybdate transport system ATP-binding protein
LILLRHGRQIQAGPTSEVLTRPCCEEAARLLDIPNIFEAEPEPATSGRSLRLRWGPHTLRSVGAPPSIICGALKFAVLPQNVLLARHDKPWSSDLENPVPAVVDEVIELGGESLVWLRPQGLPTVRLLMRLPERALRRHKVAVGAEATVCLRATDIILLGSGRDDAKPNSGDS